MELPSYRFFGGQPALPLSPSSHRLSCSSASSSNSYRGSISGYADQTRPELPSIRTAIPEQFRSGSPESRTEASLDSAGTTLQTPDFTLSPSRKRRRLSNDGGERPEGGRVFSTPRLMSPPRPSIRRFSAVSPSSKQSSAANPLPSLNRSSSPVLDRALPSMESPTYEPSRIEFRPTLPSLPFLTRRESNQRIGSIGGPGSEYSPSTSRPQTGPPSLIAAFKSPHTPSERSCSISLSNYAVASSPSALYSSVYNAQPRTQSYSGPSRTAAYPGAYSSATYPPLGYPGHHGPGAPYRSSYLHELGHENMNSGLAMGYGMVGKQRKRRGNLPKETTDKLRAWFMAHLSHPYPTEDEKQELMRQTGLQMNQISNWFINARRRQLPAMINNARAESDVRSAVQGAAGYVDVKLRRSPLDDESYDDDEYEQTAHSMRSGEMKRTSI